VNRLVVFLLGCLLSYSVAHAQVVTIPIPGSPLSLNLMANPQPLQNINNNPAATAHQLWDDGYANVPLGFTFPFFDKTFNNSTMYSNGTVQFGPHNPGNNTFCCNGITIDRNTPSAYNYSILMMQTDLYGGSGRNHYSLGNSTSMTYGWYDVERLGVPQNKTSFELKIDNTGNIDMRWSGALITMNTPAIGVIGDASKGEFAVIQQGSLNQNFTIPGLTQVTTGQTPDFVLDPCTTNPLFATTCSGYQAAYLIQQCSINPLYSTTCSGYATAYHDQQCSISALHATTCTGYAAAYKTQQCTLNPLYATDCSGYAVAYKNQQCTANPLYATDCPAYAEAYFNQQCKLDSLYSNKCEGYATAYAIKYLVVGIDSTVVNNSLSKTAAANNPEPTRTVVPTNTASTTINTDGTVSTRVSTTGDTNVDRVITSKASTTNATPEAVQLAPPPPPPQQMAQNEPKGGRGKQQDTKDDAPKGTGGNSPSQNTNTAQASSDKPAAPTARQELQARREAAAKAEAVEKGKNLAGEMGKASDLEAQKAVQNVVIQAMGFTPGFDAYSKQIIVQQQFYKPYQVYGNQKTIDNRANLRMFGGTDILHNEMVESQYKKGN